MEEIEFAMITFEDGNYIFWTKINLIAFLTDEEPRSTKNLIKLCEKYEIDDLINKYDEMYCGSHVKIQKMIGTPCKK